MFPLNASLDTTVTNDTNLTIMNSQTTNNSDITILDNSNPTTNVIEIPMIENLPIVPTNAEHSMVEILPDTSDESVTFQKVRTACQQLCHAIDGDKELMKSVLCTISQWTNHLLRKDAVEVTITPTHVPLVGNPQRGNEDVLPTAAIVQQHHYSKLNRRFKSAREYHASTLGKRKSSNVALLCEDAAVTTQSQSHSVATSKVKRARKRTKTCELCSQHGHFKETCEVLTKDNLGTIGVSCRLRDKQAREDLASEIHRTSRVKSRPDPDPRIVLPNLPKRIKGIQIHKKMFIDNNDNFSTIDITNVCIECTLILDGGIKPVEYNRVLFKPVQIAQFVTQSQSNLVCSWLSR